MAWTQAHLVNPINLQCAPPASPLLDIIIKIRALSKTGAREDLALHQAASLSPEPIAKTDAGHCVFS